MKVIINADDFGYNETITNAITESFVKGLISNTTIMPNMEYSEKAVEIAKEKGFFNRVGLHLNLREGMPLTEKIRKEKLFCNSQGKFQMKLNNLQKYFFSYKTLKKNTRIALQEEIEAQIKWYLDHGFTQKHIDSHQSVHSWYLILSALQPLLKKYNFNTVRQRIVSKKSSFIKKIYGKKINNIINNPDYILIEDLDFIANFNNLDKTKNYEVMCHPTFRDGEIIDFVSGVCIKDIVYAGEFKIVSYGNNK